MAWLFRSLLSGGAWWDIGFDGRAAGLSVAVARNLAVLSPATVEVYYIAQEESAELRMGPIRPILSLLSPDFA